MPGPHANVARSVLQQSNFWPANQMHRSRKSCVCPSTCCFYTIFYCLLFFNVPGFLILELFLLLKFRTFHEGDRLLASFDKGTFLNHLSWRYGLSFFFTFLITLVLTFKRPFFHCWFAVLQIANYSLITNVTGSD